jgi:hypothetical protein
MSKMDFQDLLTNVLQPKLINNIVLPKVSQLEQIFTKNTDYRQGSMITDPNAIAETTAGGAFTRADADPPSMTQTFVLPGWTKVYYHESALIRNEDIKEANGDISAIKNLFAYAAIRAVTQLMNTHVFSGVMTQLKADIDSSSAYSDNSITRVTALQSYEENTNTQITLAILRASYAALRLKDELDWSQYITLVEPTVWNTLWPLMDATVTKMVTAKLNQSQAAGYLEVPVFDLCPIKSQYGMTVGDIFTVNRDDVQVQTHCPLELTYKTPKEMDEWAYKVIARIGINLWVRRPAMQSKLTLKD